jgi:hypothetical protein
LTNGAIETVGATVGEAWCYFQELDSTTRFPFCARDIDTEIKVAHGLPVTILRRIINGTYVPPEPKEKPAKKNKRKKKPR